MAILYTIGNTNLFTVEIVAKNFEMLLKNNASVISKIVIFNSPESHELLTKQLAIYRRYIGNVRVEEVMLDKVGISDPKQFSSVFKESGEKFVDLTNGQKTTAALLYLSACLVGINNIYYLSLSTQEYIKLPKINNISDLARVSYFELIYYIEELDSIFENTESVFTKKTYEDIETSIKTFFNEGSARSSISDATAFVEGVILKLVSFLQEYEPAKNFSKENNVQFNTQKDPLGAVSYFFNLFSKKNEEDQSLVSLITLPGLLSALRSFRNIAAHSSNTRYDLKIDEVRIVLNMTIESLRRIRSSREFWNYINLQETCNVYFN
ncbi:hypothetical protein [Gottfriedia acidiceleris]|uniref:hypothetical protein n=1 Tax=Gottfriedia acidiceleris TaxID=371036 RepID=UPI000B43CD3C|nr:hypothetical protein [Gottfriedia acidiceleris]